MNAKQAWYSDENFWDLDLNSVSVCSDKSGQYVVPFLNMQGDQIFIHTMDIWNQNQQASDNFDDELLFRIETKQRYEVSMANI